MDERLARAIEMLRQSVRHSAQGNETETTTMNNGTMTMTALTATYTKLATGEWGLRANGALATGQQVTVTTRDGRRKVETVGAIVFTNAGVTVAAKATTGQPVTPVQPVPVTPVQPVPVTPVAPITPRVEPDALARIILDLETALAGLKALQRAA